MVRTIKKTLRKVNFYLCVVGAIGMFILMLLTVADVIGRSFFAWPVTGTYELSKYFLVIMVLLGIGYAQEKGLHVAVSYFVSKLPVLGRSVLERITTLIGLIFFSLVTWQGWRGGIEAIHNKTVSDTLHIPSFPFEFLIAAGSFFLCLELLLELLTPQSLKLPDV
jgi:TRAP-type C4-dicarboxylate transport system permease small subunit